MKYKNLAKKTFNLILIHNIYMIIIDKLIP